MAVHAVTLIANLMVSTSFPVGKEIANTLEPGVLMLLRFGLAVLIIGIYVHFRHGLTWPGWSAIWRYAVIALTVVIFFWCMFEALRYTSALNTSALFTTVPLLAAIFAFFIAGERLGRHRVVALTLGLLGALWIIFRGDPARLVAIGCVRRSPAAVHIVAMPINRKVGLTRCWNGPIRFSLAAWSRSAVAGWLNLMGAICTAMCWCMILMREEQARVPKSSSN